MPRPLSSWFRTRRAAERTDPSPPPLDPAAIDDADLLGFLDELLPPERSAAIEQTLRTSPELQQRAAGLLRSRDRGAHTLADIWRRHRLSCPDRDRLGAYLLGTLPEADASLIELHLEAVGCRWCRAERDSLLEARTDADRSETTQRRERLFESSIGRRRD